MKSAKSIRMVRERGRHFMMTVTVLLLFICITSESYSQVDNADFTGTWVINESISAPSQGNLRTAADKIVINQDSINLSVETTRSGGLSGQLVTNDKFTIDGNECVNTMIGGNTRKSTVKWGSDGKSLLFSHYMKFDMQGETREITSGEKWKINDAGDILTVETSLRSPSGEAKTTSVYEREK